MLVGGKVSIYIYIYVCMHIPVCVGPPDARLDARLDRVRKQMTVSGNMSQEMDRGESRNNWRQVKNESDKYSDHNSKRESGNAEP